MIELAPGSKVGLSLANPVMIAAGCAGYGPPYQQLIDLSCFGAIVTNPITLRPRQGPAQPRLVETPAGFVLHTGGQNPGVKKAIQQYGSVWRRLGAPVIVHLPADEPDDLQRTARALGDTESTMVGGAVAAIELGIPRGAPDRDIENWARAIRKGCLLPLLIKVPLDEAADMAEAAANAPADALVIGAPPAGAAMTGSGEIISGDLYGPALYSLALQQVRLVTAVVDAPIVAAGGVHSESDARALIQAGAAAIQIDSLIFVDPLAVAEIARAFDDSC